MGSGKNEIIRKDKNRQYLWHGWARLYTEALFLSTYKVRKHSFIPSMIYKDFSPHPFATVCIYLQHSGEDSKHVGNGKEVSGFYETDGPRLKEALKKWNVEIEIRIIVD